MFRFTIYTVFLFYYEINIAVGVYISLDHWTQLSCQAAVFLFSKVCIKRLFASLFWTQSNWQGGLPSPMFHQSACFYTLMARLPGKNWFEYEHPAILQMQMFSQSVFLSLFLVVKQQSHQSVWPGNWSFFSDKDAQKCHTRQVLPCFCFSIIIYLILQGKCEMFLRMFVHVFSLFSLFVVEFTIYNTKYYWRERGDGNTRKSVPFNHLCLIHICRVNELLQSGSWLQELLCHLKSSGNITS